MTSGKSDVHGAFAFDFQEWLAIFSKKVLRFHPYIHRTPPLTELTHIIAVLWPPKFDRTRFALPLRLTPNFACVPYFGSRSCSKGRYILGSLELLVYRTGFSHFWQKMYGRLGYEYVLYLLCIGAQRSGPTQHHSGKSRTGPDYLPAGLLNWSRRLIR